MQESSMQGQRSIRQIADEKERADRFGDLWTFLEENKKRRFFDGSVNQSSWLASSFILKHGRPKLTWQLIINGVIDEHVSMLHKDENQELVK